MPCNVGTTPIAPPPGSSSGQGAGSRRFTATPPAPCHQPSDAEQTSTVHSVGRIPWLLPFYLLPFALVLLSACSPPPAPDPLALATTARSAGDYAGAVAILAPQAPGRPDLAQPLADTRLAWGRSLVAAAPGDPAALRSAFDQFTLGMAALDPGDSQRQTLQSYQRASAALLSLLQAQAALGGQGDAPVADRIAQAEALAALAEAARVAEPELPGADDLIGGALLIAADTYRSGATVAPADAERAAWQSRAHDLCRRAQAVRPQVACPEGDPGAQAASAGPATSAPAPRRTPPPAPPGFTVAQRKSFEGSGASGRYESCIDIQILGRSGPIGGAIVGINNGEHTYQNQTDAGGYTGRCGLGASTWSVVLFWVPPGRTIQGAATTVYLSGAPEQRAAVVFQEQ